MNRIEQNTMNLLLVLIILVVPSGTLARINGKPCPEECACYLDLKGRDTVECKRGGLTTLQLDNLSAAIEILKISAPDDNLNAISMNPSIGAYKFLEEIHITKSNIPNLGERFFLTLQKLEVLNLSQNNITQPLPANFYGLKRLKELYLDDNRITSLPSQAFRHLLDLRVLSIQRNRIEQILPGSFAGIAKLRTLRLNGNFIRHFKPDVFKDIKELRSLECRGCGLKKINRNVNELLPHLSHLDLCENEIKRLEAEDFANVTNLRVLKLDANQIQSIPDGVLASNADLRKVSLARNAIDHIDADAFENLVNLTDLDLAHNNLQQLDFLEPITNLDRLVLNGNRIRPNQLVLLHGTTLKELHLMDAGLTSLDFAFLPESLQVLNLGGNHLSRLSVPFLPPNLVDLDISRNTFRGLEQDEVERLERLARCKLDANPWSCDLCHITYLLNRANKSAAFYSIRCHYPYQHKNKLLGTLEKDQLSWCGPHSASSSEGVNFLSSEDGRLGLLAAGASVLLLILTSISVLAALCYSRRHAADYYTHEEKRSCEKDRIVEHQSPLFGEELSFKFPLDVNDMRISIATIDELRKEQELNGTSNQLNTNA